MSKRCNFTEISRVLVDQTQGMERVVNWCLECGVMHDTLQVDGRLHEDTFFKPKTYPFGHCDSKEEKPPDLHTKRAAEEFGIDPADVTEQQRQVGKTLNFVELYGGRIVVPSSSPSTKTMLDIQQAIAAGQRIIWLDSENVDIESIEKRMAAFLGIDQ